MAEAIMECNTETRNSTHDLKEEILHEVTRTDRLSEQQAGRLISEMVISHSVERTYIFNIFVKLIKYLMNVLLVAMVGCICIVAYFDDQIIATSFITLCLGFCFSILLCVLSHTKLDRIIIKIENHARIEIVETVMRTVDGFDDMSKRLQEELYERLLRYAGLELKKN